MLVSLRIENFKNFRDEQNLIVYDSNEDACAFSVLVGNNGAGKSSVLDAIEWVAVARDAALCICIASVGVVGRVV